MPVIKKCEECGKIFNVVPSRAGTARFCSRECRNKNQQTGSDIICDNCGKIFHRRQYHIDRQANREEHNFCCIECRSEYKHKNSIEQRTCEICGELFDCKKVSKQRFCSPACRYVWNSTLIGELNPHYSKIDAICDYCGEVYKVKPSQYNNSNHHFCSANCRQKWYAEIHSQTDEYREKSRKRAASILKTNPQNTDTKPQLIVNRMLDGMGIAYENERVFVYYAVDNYIVNNNLIIEVMGDYWHANPTKYETVDRLNETQIKRAIIDKAKHSYIKNQYGIEILYLWEYDICNRPQVCEALINNYILNRGMLNNYHSFNYYIDDDNNLSLYQQTIIPYQDRKIHKASVA